MSAQPEVIIAKPCPVKWSAMKGDARLRHCAQCNRFVHRLSELTRAQVDELLKRSQQERVCVNVCHRADGTLLTKDAPSWWVAAQARAEVKVGRGSTTSVVGVLGLALFFVVSAVLSVGFLFGDNIRMLFAVSGGDPVGTTVVTGSGPVSKGTHRTNSPTEPSAAPSIQPR